MLNGVSAEERAAFIKTVEGNAPMGRVGTAEEVANLAGFLCSSDASYINGSIGKNLLRSRSAKVVLIQSRYFLAVSVDGGHLVTI